MDTNQYPYNVPGYHALDVTLLEFLVQLVVLLATVGFAIAVVYYLATNSGTSV